MKFAVRKSVTTSVVSFAALSMLAACGVTNQTSQLASAKQTHEVSGKHAEALFHLLEAAGIEVDTVDGRVIIGATTLGADLVHCSVAMTANQDKRCEIEKSGRGQEVSEAAVAEKAVEALEAIGARVDERLIGAINYEIKNLTCTAPVVPNPEVNCSYELSSGRASKDVEFSGDDAESIFNALESAGVQPASIDGRIIVGATTLKADAVHCSMSFDANFTKRCEISAEGREIELRDAALAASLVTALENIGAQLDTGLIGANQYEVHEVSCTRPVVPSPVFSCSLKLSK